MDADFWLQRWQEGQIGFHRSDVMPLLEKHWPSLQMPAGSRVLVPLCGKSLDMHWLAAQGHRVLGVELSPLAVTQFFEEAGLTPVRTTSPYGEHFSAGPVEIILGDAFGLDPALLAEVAGVYDRAALIALPPPMRERYVAHLQAIVPNACQGLLVTLVYDQAKMDGPPFSVADTEVEQHFADGWTLHKVEEKDVLTGNPRFIDSGLTAVDEHVFRLIRR